MARSRTLQIEPYNPSYFDCNNDIFGSFVEQQMENKIGSLRERMFRIEWSDLEFPINSLRPSDAYMRQ